MLGAAILVLAGCAAPTAPTLPLPDAPYFAWRGAPSSEQRAYADMAWERIAGCVGLDAKSLRNFPITLVEAPQGLDTVPWPLTGYDVRTDKEVEACGTSLPTLIKVVNIAECFAGGLPTEITHVAMWKKNLPGNADYSSPLWQTCRFW